MSGFGRCCNCNCRLSSVVECCNSIVKLARFECCDSVVKLARTKASQLVAFIDSEDFRAMAVFFAVVILLGMHLEVIRLVMADATTSSQEATAWVGSSMQVGALLGTLLGGWTGDACGRRTTVLSGSAGFILFSLVAAFVPTTYWWLFGLHVVKGICFGTIVSVNQPWATERLSDAGKGWASSYAHTGWTFGALLVLLFAKVGVAEGKRALETLTLVPAVFVLVIVFMTPESKEWKDESRQYLPYKDLIRNYTGSLALLAIFWVVVPGVAYIGFYWGPKMLSDFSAKDGVDYDFFMVMHGSAILASLFASTVVDYGRRKVLVIDLLVLAVGYVAMQHAPTIFLWKLSFLLVEWCITFAWTVGPILTSELFPTVFRARAFGTLQIFVRLATISGPVITGTLMDANKANFLFYGLAVLAVISALAISCVPETIAFAEEMKPFYTPQSITVTPRYHDGRFNL